MDDEELENGQEQEQQDNQQSNGGGAGGKVGQLEQKARDTQQNLQKASDIMKKSADHQAKRAARQTGQKAAKTADKAAKRAQQAQKLADAASKAGKVANMAAKLAPIIATVGIIILIAICVIGILVFLITGLGLIMSGLQQIAQCFWDSCVELLSGDESVVHDEEIRDTLQYLEEMDYDVYGYGFVTKPDAYTVEEDDDGNQVGTLNYSGGNDAYKYIKAYLISDNYAYTIKNSNKNLKTAFSSPGTFFSGFKDSSEWGSGMLGVYFEGSGGIGTKGDSYGGFLQTWSEITSKISVEDGKLRINNPGMGTTTFDYDLDGWAGRYSMPLEFLLSVHLATMAPDLSYKMATSFETNVEILLHKTSGTESDKSSIDAKVEIGGTTITKSQIKSIESWRYS